MGIYSKFIEFISSIVTYMSAEKPEEISIHNNFIKIPYIHDNKRYYILRPLHEKPRTVEHIISLLNKEPQHEIYFNKIIECKLKIQNKTTEIDVTAELERYMGPDQTYHEHKDKLTVADVIPEKYHEQFEYISLMYDTFEEKNITNLQQFIFE